jgi:uncharacterized membrane protein YqjE
MLRLWSLPKAAPLLLRHFAAYVELALEELAAAQEEMAARVLTAAILGVSMFFVIMMACLAVIARTWDTPNRFAAIVWMGAGFASISVLCALYRLRVVSAQAPLFEAVRREWVEDRVALDRILSPDAE